MTDTFDKTDKNNPQPSLDKDFGTQPEGQAGYGNVAEMQKEDSVSSSYDNKDGIEPSVDETSSEPNAKSAMSWDEGSSLNEKEE